MDTLKLFLSFEFTRTRKYFKTRKLAKVITSLLFLATFLFVGVGIYFFFLSGFRYINADATLDIRVSLTLFLYEVFLLVLGGIVVTSSLVSSIFTLFKGGNNNWVMSTPAYRTFPRFIFVKSTVQSLIPSLIMFIPAILAFIRVNHIGVESIFFILLSVIFYLMSLSALTFLAVIVVTTLYYKIARFIPSVKFSFNGLVGVLVFLVVTGTALLWKIVRDVDLVKLFRADETTDTLNSVTIANHFQFLPTHPFAMEIISWQQGLSGDAFLYFFTLVGIACVATGVLFLSLPLFYPLWQKFQEGSSQNRIYGTQHAKTRVVYHFIGSPSLVLFKKEALIFTRNFKGMLWFLFLFFIWIAQIGTNLVLNHNIQKYQTDISQKMLTLQAIQFIIAVYFVCSFTLRFVFTSLSVEKKTSWILGSAPFSFKKIFFGKYFFYVTFFTSLGIVMSYVDTNVLNLSLLHASYSMLLFIVTVIFIVTFGLSLGALFPNTETDDPEVISTSMPGLFFTGASLLYGALSTGVLYETLLTGNVFWLISFVVITICFIFGMLVKVPRRIVSR